jgi:hypothetical protein
MRVKVIGFFLLLALAAAGVAQSSPGADWTRYSSEQGKFSMLVPGQPEQNSSVEKGVVLHTFKLLVRPRLYIVIYSDYPESDTKVEITQRLQAERDGFIKGLSDARLISERQFTFKRNSEDLPALEFTSETSNVNYKCVVILDRARVYFLGTGALKGVDSTAEMERFLGSFKLL